MHQNDVNNPTQWIPQWGDSKRTNDEVCDDGNNINRDGWSSDCNTIEDNYVWIGGSSTSIDQCHLWNMGYYPNDDKNSWEYKCGDGLKVSGEQWDDNNTDSGNGCSLTCTIETSFACDGGNPYNAFDKWTYWNNSEGMHQNDINNPTQWVPQWGDSKRTDDEICDDGNNINGDGWSSGCNAIEENYVWFGGSSTSIDQCQLWNSGYYPNENKDNWENTCGDGLKVSEEQWDDNDTISGNGCSSTCTIETSYVCSGGNPNDTSDKWTYCNNSEGMHQNNVNNPTQCVPQWGDSKRAADEVCDDGNTNSEDGWSNNCNAIEDNYVWLGGSPTSIDQCEQCTSGYYPNGDKDRWENRCGDGLKVSEEQWDDNKTDSGDGCSSTCKIETNYVCDGGNPNNAYDQCEYCNNSEGTYQNDIQTEWVPQWGDGRRAGDEVCDDGNTNSGDGWSSVCTTIEHNYIWFGGSPTSIDQCEQCNPGYYPTNSKDSWESNWGDGQKVIDEQWDDSDTDSGDGCSSACTIEDNYVWSGGSPTSADQCHQWTSGYYPNENKDQWDNRWGDGLRVSQEQWDDDNAISDDGCSSACTIEDNYVWSGGSPTSADQCHQWTSGYYPNENKDQWENRCGDGLKVSEEQWDDNNTRSDDGWNLDCVIEFGFVWNGGNPNDAYDLCVYCNNSEGLYRNDINNPTQWIPQWGDGKRVGNEICDDGNTSPNDGCNSDWSQIEESWVWSGGNMTTRDNCSPSVLITISSYSSFGPAYESTSSIRAVQAISATNVILWFVMAFFCVTFVQDVWAIIHFLQLILILPLIALSMSKKIKEFIASNAFFALATYSLLSAAVKSIPLIKDLSFDQPDEYLKVLGWSSGSTLVNNFILLLILFIFCLVHLLFCLFSSLIKNKNSKLGRIVSKMYRIFTFTVYIRIFIRSIHVHCFHDCLRDQVLHQEWRRWWFWASRWRWRQAS